MHVRTVHATIPPADPTPLAAIRAAVLARRVKASPSVAALLGELCFGSGGHDRAAVPASPTGAR